MVSASPDFDAAVIGAGFSGTHMLKALRDRLGLKVRVYGRTPQVEPLRLSK
jgi:cyclohexanone monooxygenase